MNPYQVTAEQNREERKTQELRSFAKMVVYAVMFGFFIAILLAITPGGIR